MPKTTDPKPEYKEMLIRMELSQYEALRDKHAESYAQHRLPFRVWLVNLILASEMHLLPGDRHGPDVAADP